MKKPSLKNNTWWLTIQEIVSQGMGVVLFMYLAARLGETGLGVYSYLFTLSGLAALILDFGVMGHFWRKWSSDLSHIGQETAELLYSKGLVALPVAIGFLIYFAMFDASLLFLFCLAFAYTFLETIRIIPAYYFQAKNQFQKTALINISDRLAATFLALATLYFGGGVREILMVFLAARLLSIVIGYSLLDYAISFPRFQLTRSVQLLKTGSILFFVQLFTTLYFKIDTVMIRQMLNLDHVGLYNGAYKIVDTLSVIPAILGSSAFSILSNLHQGKERREAEKIILVLLKYLAIIGAFVGVFFFFYSNEILDFLYGGRFLAASGVLQLLGFSTIFVFANMVLSLYLVTQKKEELLLRRLLAITAFNVIANIFLIRIDGIRGAALTTLFSEILSFGFLIKYTGVNLLKWWLVVIFTCSGLVFWILSQLHLPLFISLAIFGSGYMISLVLFRVLSIQEILSILNPRS